MLRHRLAIVSSVADLMTIVSACVLGAGVVQAGYFMLAFQGLAVSAHILWIMYIVYDKTVPRTGKGSTSSLLRILTFQSFTTAGSMRRQRGCSGTNDRPSSIGALADSNRAALRQQKSRQFNPLFLHHALEVQSKHHLHETGKESSAVADGSASESSQNLQGPESPVLLESPKLLNVSRSRRGSFSRPNITAPEAESVPSAMLEANFHAEICTRIALRRTFSNSEFSEAPESPEKARS